MSRCVPYGKPDAPEVQDLAIRQLYIRSRRLVHDHSEHPALFGGSVVQKAIRWMKVHGGAGGTGHLRHRPDMVEVRMREQYRGYAMRPLRQPGKNSLGVRAGIDHDACRIIFRPDEVAVGLERTQRECFHAEGGHIMVRRVDRHRLDQTENEVPQPQEPVAFGFSNVKPDPLKLLW